VTLLSRVAMRPPAPVFWNVPERPLTLTEEPLYKGGLRQRSGMKRACGSVAGDIGAELPDVAVWVAEAS
jgi:hypothetical protein